MEARIRICVSSSGNRVIATVFLFPPLAFGIFLAPLLNFIFIVTQLTEKATHLPKGAFMEEHEIKKFAEIVRTLRGERSCRTFAQIVGVSYPIISRWEKGDTEPSYESLEKVAALRGQTLKEFINELKQEPSTENQEPFEKFVEKLPQIIKALPDKDLATLMRAIAYGLELRT